MTCGHDHAYVQSKPAAKTKYQIYKEATASLGSWLETTARQWGLVAFKSASTSHQKPKYDLQSHQYIQLTNLIVSAVDPTIIVPARIVRLARMTFLARSMRNQFERGRDAESDRRHEYFISIIREVYEKLDRHAFASFKCSNKRKETKEREKIRVNGHENSIFFDLLEMDDLESDSEEEGIDESYSDGVETLDKRSSPLTSEKKKKKSKKARDRQKFQAAIATQPVEEDPYFALMCLLADLNDMREYIKKTWIEYKEGKIDLVTASLTHNAAFDIIHTYEQDVPTLSPLLNDYAATIRHICQGIPVKVESNFTFNVPQFSRETYSQEENEKTTEMLYASSASFLQHIYRKKKELMNGFLYSSSLEHRKNVDRSTMSYNERLADDVREWSAFAAQIFFFLDVPERMTWDHNTVHWSNWKSTGQGKVTLSHALGAQLQVDIIQILGKDTKRGYQDMVIICRKVMKEINSFKKRLPSTKMLCCDKPECTVVEDLVSNLDLLENRSRHLVLDKDNYSKKRLDLKEEFDSLYLDSQTLMEKNPLLCGVVLFQIIYFARETGAGLARIQSGQDILSAGQLYYACKLHRDLRLGKKQISDCPSITCEALFDVHKKETNLQWSGMDHLFETLGSDHFFSWTSPKSNYDLVMYHHLTDKLRTPSDKLKKILKAQEFAKHRPNVPLLGEERPSTLTSTMVFHDYDPIAISDRLYEAKYHWKCDIHCHLNWTEDNIKALLAISASSSSSTVASGNGNKKKKGKKGQKEIGNNQMQSQVTLLSSLKERLHKESKLIRFNYLGFHSYCKKFFEHLQDEWYKIVPESKMNFDCPCGCKVENDSRIFTSKVFEKMASTEQMFGFWSYTRKPTSDTPVITNNYSVLIDKLMLDYLANHPFSVEKLFF